ncbi:MAG: SDR family oxidoreductase [Paenisporosarcina sp.]|uniref:SDR family oxidoreductase n=1 Tax=Paenisporosarcina sp. TaxID=1932001 RepID=UPI003C786997
MKKVAIVTGANSGMGLATTIELAKQGFHVVMMCRNEEKGLRALKDAISQSQSSSIELIQGDLGSFESIRNFASAFQTKSEHLDVLINNAGVVTVKRELTSEGHEAQLGVNHLGHFYLTQLLLNELQRATQGRIIVVSSGAHKWGKIDIQDMEMSRGYNVAKGYGRSKLANLLFMQELTSRLEGTNVTINAVHPGAVSTNLGINRKTEFGRIFVNLLKPFFLTPTQGAQTAIHLATSNEVASISGKYFYQMKEDTMSKLAQNPHLAKGLWLWSEQQINKSI